MQRSRGKWLLVASGWWLGRLMARSGSGAPDGEIEIGIGIWAVLAGIPVGACACGAEGRMASIGPVGPRCQGLCRRGHRFAQGKGLGGRLLKRRGAIMIKPLQPPLRAKENRQTALPAMEMHPYPRLRRYFPRRGKSALRFL